MIHHRGFVEAALPTPVREETAAASAFASDVNAFFETVRPFASTLALLAELAILTQSVALREAAGLPHDERWRIAYAALDEFLTRCLRHSPGAAESRAFVRLAKFLAENVDLARPPA